PFGSASKIRKPIHPTSLKGLNREKRYQSHKRSEFYRILCFFEMQHIVIEAVALIPKLGTVASEVVHCIGDINKVFEKLAGYILINFVFTGKLKCDAKHIQGVHRHPARAVRLFQMSARGKLSISVKNTDIVETEEPTLEYIIPFVILAVHPPCEIEEQLVKDFLQKIPVGNSTAFCLYSIDTQCGPCVDRWIYVTKRPFVGRDLTIRMHVPLTQK